MTEPHAPKPPAPPVAAVDLDHPHVPRPKWSKRAIMLGVFGVLGVVGYSMIAFADFELGAPERDEVPASVRSSPGGYRSFHFWHSGYHGGK